MGKCKYCGQALDKHPRREVCEQDKCQKRRRADNAREQYHIKHPGARYNKSNH